MKGILFKHSLDILTVKQRQRVPCRATFDLVKWHLEMMFGELKQVDERSIFVFNSVLIEHFDPKTVLLEWEGYYFLSIR